MAGEVVGDLQQMQAMTVDDRRQGGTNGLVDVGSGGEVSPVLNEAHRLPDQIGELWGVSGLSRTAAGGRCSTESRRTMTSWRGEDSGRVRSWKPNPATGCPFIVPMTCVGPEK